MNALKCENYFELFDCAQGINIDHTQLERSYIMLQQRYHPDKAMTLSREETQHAIQCSAYINQAYNVLKDDMKRAKYIMQLQGVEPEDKQYLTPEFLMLMMEWQEKISEKRLNVLLLRKYDQYFREIRSKAIQKIIECLQMQDIYQAASEYAKLQFYNRFLQSIGNMLLQSDNEDVG